MYELSRGIAVVDIVPVLNSLVGIPSSCSYEEFIRIFVEYIPKEFGRLELVADLYRNFSLKREEQEDWGACLKSKVVGNFHVGILRNSENKKHLLKLFLLLFNQNVTYCLANMKTDTVIRSSDTETVKFENFSFTLMPSLISS